MDTEAKLKIAVVAMKKEIELKMAGQGKFYDQNACVLYQALKKITES